MTNINRDEAYAILTEYTKSDALVKHALAVEGVMRHFAALYGEDAEKWGVVGLLHDVDYEMYPDEHCKKAVEILRGKGVDEEIIRAVVSHGYGLCSDVEPQHRMEKVLFAIDELTGLANAAAIMRPSKSILDMEVKSLMKKFKDARFAAGVDRGVIRQGCEMLGMDLSDLMDETIKGMREVAGEIGLKGE